METDNLQQQVNDLQKQVDNLKNIIYKDNFANLEIFRKQVSFRDNVGFYRTTPVVQQDSTGVTTVAQLITLLKAYGLLK